MPVKVVQNNRGSSLHPRNQGKRFLYRKRHRRGGKKGADHTECIICVLIAPKGAERGKWNLAKVRHHEATLEIVQALPKRLKEALLALNKKKT